MKAFIRITLFFASILLISANGSVAQRVIKGTVYLKGEPAAGVTVEAHRGSSMMTSFDGKYEVEADEKTKWLKFTFIDNQKRLDLDENSGDVIDYAMDGNLPSGDSGEKEETGVVLKSQEELIKEQDQDFMNELSLYTEFSRQKDYKSAMPHWKKLYDKYPKSHVNLYIVGARMLEDLIEKAKTDEEKDKLLDDYMKLYDKRAKYFGQKGYLLGRKATSYLKYKLDTARTKIPDGAERTAIYKKAYEWLNESVKEQGNETEMPVLVLLMQTTNSLFKLGELPKETVVKNYDICNTIINAAIADGDADRVERAKTIQPYIEDIFGKSGAADCEALVNIFTPQFKENNNDIDFIKNMLRRLRRAKCEGSQLVENATVRLYELEPSAEAAFNMARGYVKSNELTKAKDYYKQAMNQETDQDLLATYYYEYAYFIYAKEKAYSEARSYARKALDIKSDYCEALMLIGDIYVAASSSFGQDDFEKATVFWVATDYYNQARRSEDCAVDAAKKASDYKRYFPNKEEAFFRSLKEGQTYKVGGWINETTKVRF